MKNLKQLNLSCYKVEVVMNVEAWYFLHGSTSEVCNLTYFLSLLSKMTVTEIENTKRGQNYTVHFGQIDGSMLSLANEWNIGRKAVFRLLEDFEERGLIRVASNPVTSIIDMSCVKSWMIEGRVIENPTYSQSVKAFEGMRIYLFNGQRLETLRHSSAKKRADKSDSISRSSIASPTDLPLIDDEPTASAELSHSESMAKDCTADASDEPSILQCATDIFSVQEWQQGVEQSDTI